MDGLVRHCVSMKRTRKGKRCAKFAPGPGRSRGTGGLSGVVRHCVGYSRGPSGKIRCASFRKPGGPPSSRARARAGIKRSYKGQGVKVCVRTKRGPSGQKRCAKYR
jgi:hypothetical protein